MCAGPARQLFQGQGLGEVFVVGLVPRASWCIYILQTRYVFLHSANGEGQGASGSGGSAHGPLSNMEGCTINPSMALRRGGGELKDALLVGAPL